MFAVAVLELSYLFDCADGMLARQRKRASREGHLFDFFTDEGKATLLVSAMSLHLYLQGGYGPWLVLLPPRHPAFLIGGLVVLLIVANALSLTTFLRHPVISGKETPVEAFYEGESNGTSSPLRRVVHLVLMVLRFINHYPSHIWLIVLVGRLDIFFWIYGATHMLYVVKGWLGVVYRFGRFDSST